MKRLEKLNKQITETREHAHNLRIKAGLWLGAAAASASIIVLESSYQRPADSRPIAAISALVLNTVTGVVLGANNAQKAFEEKHHALSLEAQALGIQLQQED